MTKIPKINPSDKLLMGLFLSIILILKVGTIISTPGNTTHQPLHISVIEGTDHEYTLDSILVDINWVVVYKTKHKLSISQKLEMGEYIYNIMDIQIKQLINNMSYTEYLLLSKEEIIHIDNNVIITFFNK